MVAALVVGTPLVDVSPLSMVALTVILLVLAAVSKVSSEWAALRGRLTWAAAGAVIPTVTYLGLAGLHH